MVVQVVVVVVAGGGGGGGLWPSVLFARAFCPEIRPHRFPSLSPAVAGIPPTAATYMGTGRYLAEHRHPYTGWNYIAQDDLVASLCNCMRSKKAVPILATGWPLTG